MRSSTSGRSSRRRDWAIIEKASGRTSSTCVYPVKSLILTIDNRQPRYIQSSDDSPMRCRGSEGRTGVQASDRTRRPWARIHSHARERSPEGEPFGRGRGEHPLGLYRTQRSPKRSQRNPRVFRSPHPASPRKSLSESRGLVPCGIHPAATEGRPAYPPEAAPFAPRESPTIKKMRRTSGSFGRILDDPRSRIAMKSRNMRPPAPKERRRVRGLRSP